MRYQIHSEESTETADTPFAAWDAEALAVSHGLTSSHLAPVTAIEELMGLRVCFLASFKSVSDSHRDS